MKNEKTAQLDALLAARSETRAIVEAVLEIWPEHVGYLLSSFRPRVPALLDATEAASMAARKLMAGSEASFAADYRWTCDRLREEELFFHREGRYRLSTFAEADAEVYSDALYMKRYVNGLLLSQVLWYNHVAILEMFLHRVLAAQKSPFDYLEIGPGHGLMLYFAAQAPLSRMVEAWDVSAVSLRQTRAALDRLGVSKPVSLTQADIVRADRPKRKFDLIVISEVLEHLEAPRVALRLLRDVVNQDGRIFVNVPLNSPSPDHIYLLSTPAEARALVEDSGFRVEALELFATQAKPIENALANRISVSVGILAAPA